MAWTEKSPVTHFKANNKPDVKSELAYRLASVSVNGIESTLQNLSFDARRPKEAYALFSEKSSGKKWAAAILLKTEGEDLSYSLIPEWENPPYYRCARRILKCLTPLSFGESPKAQQWRGKCWENIGEKAAHEKFADLPEGTRLRWTIGDDGHSFLPSGTQIELEKVRVNSRWRWKDVNTGTVYGDNEIPHNEREYLSIS